MTVRLPAEGWGDRLLARLGKRRALRLPAMPPPESGLDVFAVAAAEPLWRALFRPRGQPAPAGWVFREDLVGPRAERPGSR